MEDNIAKVGTTVCVNMQVNITELSEKTGVSTGSIQTILHEHLNHQKEGDR